MVVLILSACLMVIGLEDVITHSFISPFTYFPVSSSCFILSYSPFVDVSVCLDSLLDFPSTFQVLDFTSTFSR